MNKHETGKKTVQKGPHAPNELFGSKQDLNMPFFQRHHVMNQLKEQFAKRNVAQLGVILPVDKVAQQKLILDYWHKTQFVQTDFIECDSSKTMSEEKLTFRKAEYDIVSVESQDSSVLSEMDQIIKARELFLKETKDYIQRLAEIGRNPLTIDEDSFDSRTKDIKIREFRSPSDRVSDSTQAGSQSSIPSHLPPDNAKSLMEVYESSIQFVQQGSGYVPPTTFYCSFRDNLVEQYDFFDLKNKRFLSDSVINLCLEAVLSKEFLEEFDSTQPERCGRKRVSFLSAYYFPLRINEFVTGVERLLAVSQTNSECAYLSAKAMLDEATKNLILGYESSFRGDSFEPCSAFFLPVCDEMHWQLFLIANFNSLQAEVTQKIKREGRRADFTNWKPKSEVIIFQFDSVHNHLNQEIVKRIKTALSGLLIGMANKVIAEMNINVAPLSPIMQIVDDAHYECRIASVPLQPNAVDCGICIVEYAVRVLTEGVRCMSEGEKRTRFSQAFMDWKREQFTRLFEKLRFQGEQDSVFRLWCNEYFKNRSSEIPIL